MMVQGSETACAGKRRRRSECGICSISVGLGMAFCQKQTEGSAPISVAEGAVLWQRSDRARSMGRPCWNSLTVQEGGVPLNRALARRPIFNGPKKFLILFCLCFQAIHLYEFDFYISVFSLRGNALCYECNSRA